MRHSSSTGARATAQSLRSPTTIRRRRSTRAMRSTSARSKRLSSTTSSRRGFRPTRPIRTTAGRSMRVKASSFACGRGARSCASPPRPMRPSSGSRARTSCTPSDSSRPVISPIYETPRLDPANPIANDTNATFLADGQNNNAWALFGDVTYDLTKQWELDAALRYDEDARENTTFTPTPFLPDPSAFFGEVRKHTWNAWQPKATVRYKPTDDWTVYADWSRGFRSGGFNQTGVAVVAAASNIKGVGDLFNAEIADTYELGIKGQMLDRRLSIDADVYHTHSRNGYFFVFLAANSTQNLGNLNATYKGAEIELTAHATDR